MIAVLLVEDADRIDDCGRLRGHGRHLRQGVRTGIVAPVADQDQHSLVAVGLPEMIEARGDSIVQRGLSYRIDRREGPLSCSCRSVNGSSGGRPKETLSLK